MRRTSSREIGEGSQRRRRHDVRAPGSAVDHRDLPEELARAERRERTPFPFHPSLPVEDHEELVSRVALANDELPFFERPLDSTLP